MSYFPLPQEYSGQIKVVKVEHDKNPELIAKYKVSPAFCMQNFE